MFHAFILYWFQKPESDKYFVATLRTDAPAAQTVTINDPEQAQKVLPSPGIIEESSAKEVLKSSPRRRWRRRKTVL